jgi:hypothetical protein
VKLLILKRLLRRGPGPEAFAPDTLPDVPGVVARGQWLATPVGGRGTLPAVELSGPGVDDLVHYIADALAESIHYGDGRAAAWTDYLVTRGNLVAAIEGCAGPAELKPLKDAVADAWDRLVPELPATVRMHMDEARLVAGELAEVAGRVGTVTA